MRSTRAATATAEEEEEEEEVEASSLFESPVFKSTEVRGEHWVEGKLVTRLPYRDIVAKDLYYVGVLADREWIIGISVKVRLFVLGYIYFKETNLTERTDRDLRGCITPFIM